MSLQPMPPSGMELQTLRQMWAKTVERVKQIASAPVVFRAVEAAVPIAWEEKTFVVGFGATTGQMGGVLNTGEYRQIVERALREVTGDAGQNLRVIEGDAFSDWVYAKQRDAALARNQTTVVQKQVIANTAYGSWDDIYEQVSRLWSQSDNRSTATGRARYLGKAMALVSEAMPRLYSTGGGKADDAVERGLARVVERIGSYTNSDPAILAYLLFQRSGIEEQK